MRPRIGFDARFALGERRGIGNYALELVKAMAALDHEFDFVFYSDRPDREGLLSNLPHSHIRVLRPGLYPFWEQVRLPLALHHDGIDLFHAVGNTAPLIMPRSTKLLVTLHDVMFMKDEGTLPVSRSWYQRAGRLYRRMIVPPAIRNADHVLTVSEFSKADILNTFMNIRPEKISVIHHGLSNNFSIDSPLQDCQPPIQGTPYLLHLGGLDPRKNTPLVVRSFLDLKRSGRLEEMLIILGLNNLESLRLNPEEISEAKQWIYLPGFVSAIDLPNYYRHATAFLFPSLYEGFGIPLLEAMASGTPIITSRATCLPEIAGNAAMFVHPKASSDIKEAILQLLANSDLHNSLVEAGRIRVQVFNWSQTVAKTLNCYKDLLQPAQCSRTQLPRVSQMFENRGS